MFLIGGQNRCKKGTLYVKSLLNFKPKSGVVIVNSESDILDDVPDNIPQLSEIN